MAALHVESRGEGPLVVLSPGLWSPPGVFAGLVDDLAADHRVVTYDQRGTGRSQPEGPYDVATDVADLEGIVASHGPPATLVGAGAGSTFCLHVLVEHPELVTAVVCPSGSPVNRAVGGEDSDSFAGSRGVFDLLNELAVRDYRAFLHSIVASTNPQLDEAGVTARVAAVVDHSPHEVTLARLRAWLRDDAVALSLAARDRLTIVLYGSDPWASPDAAAATRALLPEAEVLEVEDGPLSRPDISAAIVRRRSGVAA
jgi:pimeloyl-ACP methyl ester carboxylesterase